MSAVTATKMQTLSNEAARCFEQRDYERAAMLLGECLLTEQTSDLWNDWATAMFFGRRPAEAERGYRRALEINPDNAQAAENLGSLLAGQGRTTDALPFLEKAAALTTGTSKPVLTQLLTTCRTVQTAGTDDRTQLFQLYKNLSWSLTQQSLAIDRVLFRLATLPLEFSTTTERALRTIAGATPATSPVKLPTLTLDEIFRNDTPTQLRSPRAVDGNTSIFELVVLNTLLQTGRATTVFEIGTFDGRTTLNLAANLPADGHVYTLDLPSTELGKTRHKLGTGDHPYVLKDASGTRFQNTDVASKITQLHGDSGRFDFSPYQGKIDFVFIDGAHTREYVLNDSNVALKLLRNGTGQIVWHDYPSWTAVANAIHELRDTNPAFAKIRHIPETNLAYLKLG